MTLPNHSRRPAKMKEQVVQDDQNGFQKEKIVGKYERFRRWLNFIWHGSVGRGVGSKAGFTAEKSGKKGDRCRASWGEWDTTGQRTVPCLEGRMQQSFCGDSVGS